MKCRIKYGSDPIVLPIEEAYGKGRNNESLAV